MTVNSAGDLRSKVAFQRRKELVTDQEKSDRYGNALGEWETVIECRARLQPRLGSEEVVAARLQGKQPYILTVRSSKASREVTPAWRAYDARAGMKADGVTPKRLFDIKSVSNVDERDQFLDFLVVQEG